MKTKMLCLFSDGFQRRFFSKLKRLPPVQKPHVHHHNHTEEINSQTFIFDKPFDTAKLQLQLSVYLTFQSNDLYRMKGLVWLKGEDEQFVLQSVGKRFNFEKKRLWKPSEKRQSILVFIGKRLERHGIQRILTSCLTP